MVEARVLYYSLTTANFTYQGGKKLATLHDFSTFSTIYSFLFL